MPIRWDDLEILRLIDNAEQSGEPPWAINGTAILQGIAQAQDVIPTAPDEMRCARELDNLRDTDCAQRAATPRRDRHRAR